jgi:flagellar hook-length control protein FliK
MQLLKDSLEKQGLSVQGFSVSVRQDSYRGAGENNQYKPGEKEEKSKTGVISGINASNEINLEKLQRLNPYTWSDSQINLTA